MAESVGRAVRHGVALGAHPGYRDLVGFGRRALDTSPASSPPSCWPARRARRDRARIGRARAIRRRRTARCTTGSLSTSRGPRSPRRSRATTRPCPCSARRRVRSSGQRMPRASDRPRGLRRPRLRRRRLARAPRRGRRDRRRPRRGGRRGDRRDHGRRRQSLSKLAPDSLCLHGDTPGRWRWHVPSAPRSRRPQSRSGRSHEPPAAPERRRRAARRVRLARRGARAARRARRRSAAGRGRARARRAHDGPIDPARIPLESVATWVRRIQAEAASAPAAADVDPRRLRRRRPRGDGRAPGGLDRGARRTRRSSGGSRSSDSRRASATS